jgi:hypothetical protein
MCRFELGVEVLIPTRPVDVKMAEVLSTPITFALVVAITTGALITLETNAFPSINRFVVLSLSTLIPTVLTKMLDKFALVTLANKR